MNIQKEIVSAAINLAADIGADSILAITETGRIYGLLEEEKEGFEVIALTPNKETFKELSKDSDALVIDFSVRDSTRTGQIRHAVWRGLSAGYLSPGDLVVCLTGEMGLSGGTDTVSAYLISETESTLAGVIESDPVMNSAVELATELGWEGREGEPIGTAILIGDEDKVMNQSHQLGLNPFKGYDIEVTDRNNWDLIKRYAFLDGAFILDDSGRIVAAGRFLDAEVEVDIPTGLGTRHISAAAMTAATHSKAVTVSGTDGNVRIFSNGKMLGRLDPRTKMLKETSI
ncbi:MAG: diadenylate cyclase [Candidatus Hadarchaeia archaeon]